MHTHTTLKLQQTNQCNFTHTETHTHTHHIQTAKSKSMYSSHIRTLALIHTHTHACTHTHTHMHACTHTPTHTPKLHTETHTHTHTHTYTHASKHAGRYKWQECTLDRDLVRHGLDTGGVALQLPLLLLGLRVPHLQVEVIGSRHLNHKCFIRYFFVLFFKHHTFILAANLPQLQSILEI